MARKPSSEDLEQFRTTLARMLEEITGDIDGLEADAFLTDGERASPDSLADSGSDSFAQEFSLELLQRDEVTLGEIDEALKRLTKGAFGRCESCTSWIPKSRLNAVPYARLCVSCKRAAEEEL